MGAAKVPDAPGAQRAGGRHTAAGLGLAIAFAAALGVPAVRAATLVLDPEAAQVRFALGATLHTVEGSFALEEGRIGFEPGGGAASGRVVLDARSAETGIDARDEALHEDVLESDRHPAIVFRPTGLEVVSRQEDRAEVRLAGELVLQGEAHPVELPARIERIEGDRVRVETELTVPYVAWGLEDPSNFLLRVDKEVAVRVRAEGRLEGTSGRTTGELD